MSDQPPQGVPHSGYRSTGSGSQGDGSRYEVERGSGQADRAPLHGSTRNQDRADGRHPQRPPSHHPYQGHTLAPPPIRLIPGQPPPFLRPPFHHQQYQQPQPHHSHPQKQHGSHYHPHDRPHHPGHFSQEQQQHQANQFPLHPLDRFKVKCAAFRQPIEIGSFSYDEKRNFVMDDSQLKYYFPPDLTKPNNLSVNYDKYIAKDSTVDEHIDALLDALICIRDREQEKEREEHEKQVLDHPQEQGTEEDEEERICRQNRHEPRHHLTPSMTQANFICYRGILTKIMCTPYSRNEPWELGATLYKGTIYIEEHVSAEKRQNSTGTNERHKLMSYWGYRFETICNISKPVSELRRIKTKKRHATYDDPQTESGASTAALLGSADASMQDRQRKQAKVDVQESVQEQQQKPDLDSQLSPDCEPRTKSLQLDDGTAAADVAASENRTTESETEMVETIDLQDPELTGRLDGIVDTNLQYCTVARTKIGQNSIIMGAEVDCTSEPKKPAPDNPLSNYIELKTSRIISSAREQSSFERHKLLKFWAQSFLPGIPTIIVGFRDDDGNVVTVEKFKTMEIPRLVRGKDGAWDTTICINFLDGVFNFLRKMIVVDDPEVTYTIRWAYPFKAIEVEFAGKRDKFLTDRFLKRWS
ncbi:hypothetical protein BGZ75_008092 [Mortierella antarctica]|nr:hypothetical protein BGZ75_008092 [Mortierella antarctica]